MRLKPGTPVHRIPSGAGVNKDLLARRIVKDLLTNDSSLNGCMIRLDGGEQ